MELTTDAILKGPIWAAMFDKLKGVVFETNWDIYALSISIGMMYDAQIESDAMVPDGYEAEPRYVPRNVLGHDKNKALLEFMLQTALVTTKHLDLDEDTRLAYAFDDQVKVEFNPVAFLTKYANYGITKINEVVSDTNDVETLEALMTFLNSTYEFGAELTANISNLAEEIDE